VLLGVGRIPDGVFEVAVGYEDGLSLDECRELVLRAMRSALARDATSGNGIDLLLMSREGIKEENLPA